MRNVSSGAKVRGGGRQWFYSKSFERISATLSLADPKQGGGEDPPHTLRGNRRKGGGVGGGKSYMMCNVKFHDLFFAQIRITFMRIRILLRSFIPLRFFQIRIIMAVSGTKYTKKFNRHYKERLENYLSIASLCFWLTYFQASLMDPDPATFTNAKFSRNWIWIQYGTNDWSQKC
jgi:hypothetical protein